MRNTFTITLADRYSAAERTFTVEAIDKEHARRIASGRANDCEYVYAIIEAGTLHLVRYTENGRNCWDIVEAETAAQAVEILREIEPKNPVEIVSVESFDNYADAVNAAYAGDRAQEEQPAALVDLDELAEDLDTGDEGDVLSDYRDSSTYICDAISEAADQRVSIYYCDLLNFISDHPEALADVVAEGLYDPSHKYDIWDHARAAQYMVIERDLYDHLADNLMRAALCFIRHDLKRLFIPAELAELLREWCDEADNNDRMDEIPDRIREYFDDLEGGADE